MQERRSLLSSAARVQAPWIKVVIGDYTFGVFNKVDSKSKDGEGFYKAAFNIQYPNFIQSLDITKINGRINQYTLSIAYPVRPNDDPNFFEKVFSSVSKTRKIVFSYGDMSMPSYIYKNEEAIITKVSQNFNLQGSVINYTINAVSSASLNSAGSWTFPGGKIKPSDEIKRVLGNDKYGLKKLFPGMTAANIHRLIAGDDKIVEIKGKQNISALDYINYLVGCMIPENFTTGQKASSDIYILTLHDDSTLNEDLLVDIQITGAYFKVTKVTYNTDKADAFQIDIGFGNTGTIVTNFSIVNDENYSLLYDYSESQSKNDYVYRLDNQGNMNAVWSPAITSKNSEFMTRSEDIVWWTKMTKYPIKASITINGLLRPAMLMTYVRLNVIFPGGNKHVASGLYLVTEQKDRIDGSSGYKTTLQLTKIAGSTSALTN